MEEQVLERMLREGRITAEDVLRKTTAGGVDGMTEVLLHYLPYDEVRCALYERSAARRLRHSKNGVLQVLRTLQRSLVREDVAFNVRLPRKWYCDRSRRYLNRAR
jgi:hypothetical protein